MSYQKWSLVFELAALHHPLDPPTDPDWGIYGNVREFTFSRGRRDDLDRNEPLSATVVLDNGLDDLDQLLAGSAIENTQALPFTPARIRATRDADAWNSGTAYVIGDVVERTGVVYRCISGHTNHVPPNATYWVVVPDVILFSGYTLDGFEPKGARGAGTLTVNVTDWLGWAAQIPFPDCRFAAWVTTARPELWMRGNMTGPVLGAGGTDYAYNMARLWGSAEADMVPNGAMAGYTGRSDSIVPGSTNPGFNFPNGVLGGATLDTRTDIAQSGAWGVMFWMQANVTGSTSVGGTDWSITTNGSGHMVASVKVGATTFTATVAFDHCDGNPHLVKLGAVTSGGGTRLIALTTDLGSATTSTAAENGVSGGGLVGLAGSEIDSIIDELCYWATTSPPTGPAVADWVAQTDDLWFGDTAADRLTNVCDACAVPEPSWDVTLDDPALQLHKLQSPTNLADAVTTVAQSFLGEAYCLRDGTVRVRDALFTSADSADYTDLSAQLTDDPAAAAPPVVVRTTRQRTGTRSDRVVNEFTVNRVATTSVPEDLYYLDATSAQRYGPRQASISSEAESAVDLVPYATAYIGNRLGATAASITEVGDLEIRAWGRQDVTDWLFETLELDQAVTYREAIYKTGDVVIDDTYRVLREEWSWSGGTEWVVTLRVGPT